MFDIEKLYTAEEMALAATVPLTDEILIQATRVGTGGLAWFGYEVINPQIEGLLKPTDQEQAVISTFLRLIALVRTCYELSEPHQFQSVAAGARAIFELSIDAALLSDSSKGTARAAQYHGHTRIARYRAAQKLMAFYHENPALHDPADTEPQRELLSSPGLDTQLEQLAQSLWNFPLKNAPDHWTSVDMATRARWVSAEWEHIYRQWVPRFHWYVHSGGAGVGGISPKGFGTLGLVSRDVIRLIVPGAYRAVGNVLYLTRALPDFFDKLDYAKRYVELIAVTEARLQAAGHPGKVSNLGSLL